MWFGRWSAEGSGSSKRASYNFGNRQNLKLALDRNSTLRHRPEALSMGQHPARSIGTIHFSGVIPPLLLLSFVVCLFSSLLRHHHVTCGMLALVARTLIRCQRLCERACSRFSCIIMWFFSILCVESLDMCPAYTDHLLPIL